MPVEPDSLNPSKAPREMGTPAVRPFGNAYPLVHCRERTFTGGGEFTGEELGSKKLEIPMGEFGISRYHPSQ